jgi:epoxyqueuosine reductase
MGNALRSSGLGSDGKEKLIAALRDALPNASEMLKEHIEWALEQSHKVSK